MLPEQLIDWSISTKEQSLLNDLHLTRNDLLHPGFEDNHQILQMSDQAEILRAFSVTAYITELVRNIDVMDVKHSLRNVPATDIFLRGSGATGLFPLGDYDISHYGPRTDYRPNLWPQTVSGTPVSWGQVPLEELAECMDGSLRMSSSVLEGIPISEVSDEVAQIIDATRQSALGQKRYYYLMFRGFEQHREKFGTNSSLSGYAMRKEMPGSKRTIQRICWSIQMLEPSLSEERNPNLLLIKAYYQGIIPFELVTNTFNAMMMIRSDGYDEVEFRSATSIIQNWYQTALIPRIDREIALQVEPHYLRDIYLAQDEHSSPVELTDVVEHAMSQETAYKKWLSLWIVSHNSTLPAETQYEVWKMCLGKMVHRNTLRNLLRNPSFPLNRVTREEVIYDPHLLECYSRVTRMSS